MSSNCHADPHGCSVSHCAQESSKDLHGATASMQDADGMHELMQDGLTPEQVCVKQVTLYLCKAAGTTCV